MADSVKVSLGLVVDGFNLALKSAEKQTETFQKRAVSNFDFVQKSFAVMAGTLAANALQKVTGAIGDSFGKIIDEAKESEDGINNLNIALKAAGLFSEASSTSLQTFAAELQKVSIYSGDAILASSTLLLNLTNLDEKGIQAATRAATDLAATLNIELSEATDMISKAINGNVTAFKKKGIEIQSADTDAKRLANTLAALASQQGASTEAANTYSGAIAKQTNQQNELLGEIGKLFTQNTLVIQSVNAMADAFAGAATFISENRKLFDDLAVTAGILTGVLATAAVGYYAVSTALGVMAIAAATGVTGFQALGIAAGFAWSAVTAPVTIVVASIAAVGVAIYALVKYWDDVKAATYNALAAGLDFAADMTSVFSADKTKSLRDQANAWRDKATAIKEADKAIVANDQVDAATAANRTKRLNDEREALNRLYTNKAEAKRINGEQLNEIENQQNIAELEAMVAHQQVMAETTAGFNAFQLEDTLANQLSLLEARQKHEANLLELQIQSELNRANLETDKKARTDAINKVNDKADIDRAKLKSKQEVDILKAQLAAEAQIAKMKEQNQKDTFATIATLSSSNNQTLASIGKAAGITQIAIDTPVAIGKALAAFPPPFNFVAAGLVGTAMAAQAAAIAGVKFADGGIVPGSDMTGDRIRASLNSGEMVLNKQQQAALFNIANNRAAVPSAGGGITRDDLVEFAQAISDRPISVQIDGREVFNVMRTQTSSGRSY